MDKHGNLTHRVAVLDQELCQPRKCGLECIIYCPVNKTGGECIIQRPDDGKAVISEELCTGCTICIKKCPFDAIVIVNLAQEIGVDKIHQYGVNSFRLYKIPIPKEGTVTGIVGRNGMGKSTIINLLSGNIKPNFGNYDKELGWDEILTKLSNIELRKHFEKIQSKSLRTSIKPQLVYLIPKVFKGTVSELLKKYDERGVSDLLIEELSLKYSLDRDLSTLSGGELQRVAVAVAAAKDAEYYFFDEPSSFNDIYQRLAVGRVINNLAKEGKTVMIVEHDMSLLDYLSDNIYITYGEPGAYGIVSSLQSTKVGINNFLEGYIPTENVRFRDKAYKFDISSITETVLSSSPIVEYTALTKTLGQFSLTVDKGEIHEGEVVGIVGANALGKTTFMRMLAGIEKIDKGSLDTTVRISYKPQYLNQDIDGDVRSLIYSTNGGPFEGTTVEEHVFSPLGIKKLYDKSIKGLSGGELQKVAISLSLIRPADVYALDEPSAFLDIEDRITFAKFIQRFTKSNGKSALIIDHDIQLIDLVSDRLVMFEGIPGINGTGTSPTTKEIGMNNFLQSLSISFRRDETTGRPRVNKDSSRLDRQQKTDGNYYYLKNK
ncbi:Putative HMP/thiamine import ATP-binding protein YkoD [Candidatus Nitrosocosmicus oleophilus]|uniref:HMP/thiamine import ATP-binding protein YkoD n=1 Tax=Candidatus Nitrosocosmicus oleophilus TaxID=1353260 RepID=A0A654LZF7_9ARCH|nr:ribosome biogenesis/translation initiation ATPase RLI [Candidatus Nitrosocosmicus oleophilus]ALI36170.1 Putative HMP/thiamine import ATP-binding protein YkoD [Candidatus Nitrosocosmicus oleophilus]